MRGWTQAKERQREAYRFYRSLPPAGNCNELALRGTQDAVRRST